MIPFVDTENKVHYIPSIEFINYLPEGCKEITPEQALDILRPSPSEQEVYAQYEAALDVFLDGVAQGYRYGDRTRLALRAGYPNQHQALASDFGTWMDRCNDQAKQLYVDVKEGRASLPTIPDFIASFPAFSFSA
jgi:hypothetical protein